MPRGVVSVVSRVGCNGVDYHVVVLPLSVRSKPTFFFAFRRVSGGLQVFPEAWRVNLSLLARAMMYR